MAREREVNIIVDGQNRSRGAFLDVRRGLREMDREGRRATSNFSRNFTRMDSAVLSFSNRMQRLDKIAKRTFQGTAAATSIYAATTLRSFAQLEDGISKVNTLYDQTQQSQRKMTQDSMQMFKLIPTDFEKITQGIYDSISAGADSKYATMVSRKFGQASVAGMTEMPVVTKAAMGTMNAFGKEVKDLNHILDVQFLTVKRGITEYSQLASSLDTGILKAADSAGMSIEALYGGIAQITKNSIPAAQATTQLGSMLARVTDPKVIKNMKEFGVELQDDYNRTRPLVEILKDLNEQFEKRKMTGAQQAGFLKEVLGRQEAVRGFQTLISQVKEYGEIVDEMHHADGTMGEAFEDRLNNINTQLKLVWNNMKAAGVEQLYTLKPFFDSLTEPLIMKQKLELEKMDLQDQLTINEDKFEKEKMSEYEYLIEKKLMSESIALINIELKNLDLTPVDKFRDALDESTDKLKELSPILGGFVDVIGGFLLNFVGEEGADNREIAGNVAKGLGALYLGSKIYPKAKGLTMGGINLFNKLRGKGSKKGSPTDTLTKTMQTMNVNANIVNVYGSSINNMMPGGGGGSGGNFYTPAVDTTLKLTLAKATYDVAKTYGAKLLAGETAAQIGMGTEIVKDSAIALEAVKDSAAAVEAALAAKEAMTAFISGTPVFALAGIQLYRERERNKKRERNLEIIRDPNTHKYDPVTNTIVTKEDWNKFAKIPQYKNVSKEEQEKMFGQWLKGKAQEDKKHGKEQLFVPTKSKDNKNDFLEMMNKVNQLDRTINMKNEVKVEAPKVSVYIDNKNANQYIRKIDYAGVEKHQEIQSRRYGRG